MKSINELTLLILDTILRINAEGHWHGNFFCSGISGRVEVYFRPADFAYMAPLGEQPRMDLRSAYADLKAYDDEAEQMTAFEDLLKYVNLYLQPHPAEPLPPGVSIFDIITGTAA